MHTVRIPLSIPPTGTRHAKVPLPAYAKRAAKPNAAAATTPTFLSTLLAAPGNWLGVLPPLPVPLGVPPVEIAVALPEVG